MADRKGVIEGLQEIVDSDWMWKKADYWARICKDALDLLEEQEPVKWIDCGDSYKCSRCGVYVDKSVRFKMDSTIEYCPHCGKKVQ